jgi:Mor family transcriptional regulator
MNYQKAKQVLPEELIIAIQEYIDGECIYIPRKTESKKNWGENTNIRHELDVRNAQIYMEYQNGLNTNNLADKYCLSIKSIQRIVLMEKNKIA